jgi:hypothetical protein
VSEIGDDIKATSADLVADAKRVQEIETRKQHLDPGDPRADELAIETERITEEMARKARVEHELTRDPASES